MCRSRTILAYALVLMASSSCEEPRSQITESIVGTCRSDVATMPWDIEPRVPCVLELRADRTFELTGLPGPYQPWAPGEPGVRDLSGRWSIEASETLEGERLLQHHLALSRRYVDKGVTHDVSVGAEVFRVSGRDVIQVHRQGEPELHPLQLGRDPVPARESPR